MARLSVRPGTLRKKPEQYTAVPGIRNADDILKSFGSFLKLLSDMEKKGETKKQGTGEINLPGGKAMYGFSVKIGGAGKPQYAHIGNVMHDTESGRVVEDTREPIVDLHEENDQLEIIAELPGVHEKDISYEIKEDIIILNANSEDRKYSKEILLPSKVAFLKSSYKNGIYRLILKKEKDEK